MKKKTGLLGLMLFVHLSLQAQTLTEIMDKSSKAMTNATHLSYHFFATERFDKDKFEYTEVKIKYQGSPLKIHVDAIKPQTAKLVYIPSVSDKVQVKKGLKINLSPYSSLLMGQQHHPVYKAGFNYIKATIEQSMKSRGVSESEYGNYAKIKGTVTYDGKPCWHIEIIDPDYKITTYTVKTEKNVWELGKKLAIPEFRVKQLNNIDDALKPGQVLRIPSSYSKKTTIYVCKATYLPIYQKTEDDLGLYEIFEFKSLKTGVKFTEADFQL